MASQGADLEMALRGQIWRWSGSRSGNCKLFNSPQ